LIDLCALRDLYSYYNEKAQEVNLKVLYCKINVFLLLFISVFFISATNRPVVLKYFFITGKKYEIYNYTRISFSGINQLFKSKKKNLLSIIKVDNAKAFCEISSLLEISGNAERLPVKHRKQTFNVFENGNVESVLSGKKLEYYRDVFVITFPDTEVSSGTKWNSSLFYRWLKKDHEINVVANYETTSEFRGRDIGVISFEGSLDNLKYGNKTYRIAVSGKMYFDLGERFMSFVFLKVSTYKVYNQGSYLLSSTVVKVVKIRRM
jgi:hypothetical protein